MSVNTAHRDYLGNTLTQFPLERCPFCGCPVKIEAVSAFASWGYGVVCRSGEGHGGSCCMEQVPSRTVEAAAKRWNMRKPMEQIKAEHETLRIKLDVSEDTRSVLRGSLAQAEADVDALRKDAERYRWLSQVSTMADQLAPDTIDAAIALHAAMAKEVNP